MGLLDRLASEAAQSVKEAKKSSRRKVEIDKAIADTRLPNDVQIAIFNRIASCNRTNVAKAARMDTSTISKIVTGDRVPSMSTAIKIAKVLKIQPGDVVEYTQYMLRKREEEKDYEKRVKKPGGRGNRRTDQGDVSKRGDLSDGDYE